MISKTWFCTSLCVYVCPIFPSRWHKMFLLFVLSRCNNWVKLSFPSSSSSAVCYWQRQQKRWMTSKRYFHSAALFLDYWLSINSPTSWQCEMVSWYDVATLWNAGSWWTWKHFGAFFHSRKAVGDVSFFFILLVYQISFSFLDDAIVAEGDIDSEKKNEL